MSAEGANVDHRNRLNAKEKAALMAACDITVRDTPRFEAIVAVVEGFLATHPPDRAFQLIKQGIRREQVPPGNPASRRGYERGLRAALAVVEHVRDTWAEGGRS